MNISILLDEEEDNDEQFDNYQEDFIEENIEINNDSQKFIDNP